MRKLYHTIKTSTATRIARIALRELAGMKALSQQKSMLAL
jgi:hypothetical protein